MNYEKTAFFYPTQSVNTSSKSPADTAFEILNKQDVSNNSLISLTEGKHKRVTENFLPTQEKNLPTYYNMSYKNTFGRTVNIPKNVVPGVIPGPSYNGGLYMGEPCVGPHCPIPVEPTSYQYNFVNLRSAEAPNDAYLMYQSIPRMGNNTDDIRGLTTYKGTPTNPGPFNIIVRENSFANKPY